jgi:hypothetical protein
LTDITPQRFWQRVLHKMERSVCDESLKPAIVQIKGADTFDLFDLEDLFLDINQRGLSIVLYLDEFEYVTRNAAFGPDFFGGLRALAIHTDLALVTATRRELVELCHSEEIKGSPFFNIFATVVLRPFKLETARSLIDGYTRDTAYTMTADEKALAIDLGGGFPFFLQMAGCTIVDAKWEGLAGPVLQTWVKAQFDQQASPHFDYYWSRCSESEKITLLAILALSQPETPTKEAPTAENLVRMNERAALDLPALMQRGLVRVSNGTYKLLSSSLAHWITLEIMTAPGEEESEASVEAWLSGRGRERIAPIKGFLPKFKKKYWPVIGDMVKDVSVDVASAVAIEMLTKGIP